MRLPSLVRDDHSGDVVPLVPTLLGFFGISLLEMLTAFIWWLLGTRTFLTIIAAKSGMFIVIGLLGGLDSFLLWHAAKWPGGNHDAEGSIVQTELSTSAQALRT